MEQKVKLRRALISVFDKRGIVEFAQNLADLGVEIVTTGGTRKLLQENKISTIDISELTGFPEMMDGRVKTLHPKVHGGLLAKRDNEAHKSSMRIHQIPNIDMVVVNLYPFEKTIRSDASYDEIIENIDIGGPAMIRSAAKNHAFVTTIIDPADYGEIINELKEHGDISLKKRQKLAAKAFARTASYDGAIANWFAKILDYKEVNWRIFAGRLSEIMRYGENPHQWAAFYKDESEIIGVASAKQIQGKKLSYNNINDTDAAFELVSEFDPEKSAAVAIIKHANPCGVGLAENLDIAYQKALMCDRKSAFGGIVALNREIDEKTAREIVKIFTEVIIAPAISPKAQAIIGEKKNLRLLITGNIADVKAKSLQVKSVMGAMLVQERDNKNIDDCELQIVSKRAPTEQELADLKIAAKVAKHVKSNAIVYVKNGATVGIGAGQMSRIDSTKIAYQKAKEAAKEAGIRGALTKDSVVASDAFFPFADGLLAAIEAGATAVIQPGGSIRDDEVIEAANKANIAMVFTSMRHFRH